MPPLTDALVGHIQTRQTTSHGLFKTENLLRRAFTIVARRLLAGFEWPLGYIFAGGEKTGIPSGQPPRGDFADNNPYEIALGILSIRYYGLHRK